jgi:hypothetical protein
MHDESCFDDGRQRECGESHVEGTPPITSIGDEDEVLFMNKIYQLLRHQEQQLDPVPLHERILADERHLRGLVLTRKQGQPHIILLATSSR